MSADTNECRNCGEEFEDWEHEPGEMQPPAMPRNFGSDTVCRPCWDQWAEYAWEADRVGGDIYDREIRERVDRRREA